jgi:hypothetical protein
MESNEQLLEAFKKLCLQQRQSHSTELTEASRLLAIKLFFKGAELERFGDFGRGTYNMYINPNGQLYYPFTI